MRASLSLPPIDLRPNQNMNLQGKKLLITGVINRESIAYEVAKQAQAGRRGDRADRLRPREAHDRPLGGQA